MGGPEYFWLANLQDLNYNAVYSPSVTSHGLVFTTTVANQYGSFGGPAGSQLEYANFDLVVLGGPTAGTATQLIGVWLTSGAGGSLSAYAAANGYTLASGEPYSTVQDANAYVGINPDAGLLMDPSGSSLTIPGVSSSPGYLDLFLWEGNYSSYGDAVMADAPTATTGVFAQATASGGNPPPSLSMPDVLLVPEPGTLALAGLGGLSLLLFRHRK